MEILVLLGAQGDIIIGLQHPTPRNAALPSLLNPANYYDTF